MLNSNSIIEHKPLRNTDIQKVREIKQFIINCTRNRILLKYTYLGYTPTWLWSITFHIFYDKSVTCSLPNIPYLVTDFSTVSTALKNFLTSLSQLNQICRDTKYSGIKVELILEFWMSRKEKTEIPRDQLRVIAT